MLPNYWYVILESKEIKKDQFTGVTRLGQKLVLWRDAKNLIHCISDICAHRGASLCAGKLVDNHMQCPFHGMEYDETGRCVLIPAERPYSTNPTQFQS